MEIGVALEEINNAAVAPFAEELPLMPIFLVFVLALMLAGQWRAIVDRIERIV